METINNSLAKIEAVLKAVDSFETTASTADFEKKVFSSVARYQRGIRS